MKLKATKYSKNTISTFSRLELEHPEYKQKINVYIGSKAGSGGTARVKRGFVDLETKKPVYAIKIFYPHLKNAEINAKNEAESHALFGEKAFYFSRVGKNGTIKWCTLEPWCDGEELMNYIDKVQQWCEKKHEKRDPILSILERFKLIIQIFKILRMLHLKKKIHGDLKPHNFIIEIDYTAKTVKSIKLIDKASIHDEGTSGEIMFTRAFLPLELMQKNRGKRL